MGHLDNTIAVVTGSSRGIGRAVAEAFTTAGATVMAAERTSGCDVSRETDVERLFGEVSRRHGRLDILVNNAGVVTPRKPMAEVTAEEWDASLAVNLRGVFLCARAALRQMIPQHRGLIINVSSGVGRRAAPMWGPYAVSKWGVEGFTKTVAAEVQQFGISVIAVNPGPTRTAMRALAYPAEDPLTLPTPAQRAAWFVALAAGEINFQTGDSLDCAG